jgi:DNA-binding response OmpR family regulator
MDVVSKPVVGNLQPRVLIVDDQCDNRELLAVILASEHYVVVCAASGEEALDIVAREPPDLVLLDIMMPGKNGYQVVVELKANPATKKIPVIMVSALDGEKVRELARNVGADGFLTKPVDHAVLCARIGDLLRP